MAIQLEALSNYCTTASHTATAKPLPFQVLLARSSFTRLQGAELTNKGLLLQTVQTSNGMKLCAFTCVMWQYLALTMSQHVDRHAKRSSLKSKFCTSRILAIFDGSVWPHSRCGESDLLRPLHPCSSSRCVTDATNAKVLLLGRKFPPLYCQ